MLRRTVALVVAFIAAFFALPAADAIPPDATKADKSSRGTDVANRATESWASYFTQEPAGP